MKNALTVKRKNFSEALKNFFRDEYLEKEGLNAHVKH